MADNLTSVRRGFEEVWNQGKLSVIDEVNAPDLISHNTGRPDDIGVAAFKKFVTDARTAFPDVHFTIDELIAQGDTFAVRATITGTHTGLLAITGEIPPLPPTGKRINLAASIMLHLKGGKIAETWAVVDNLDFLGQLGVFSPAALAAGATQPQQAQQPHM